MDNQITITLIGIISSGITGLFGWAVGRRKKNAEVDGVQLSNLNKQMEVYRLVVDDLQKQLSQYIKDNEQIRADMVRLKKTVGRIVTDVCITKNCSQRVYLNDTTIDHLLNGNNQESDKKFSK